MSKNIIEIKELKEGKIVESVQHYRDQARRGNTLKAYKNETEFFLKKGFKIPASPEDIAVFLVDNIYKEDGVPYAYNTLKLRVAALSFTHREAGLPDPTQSPIVRQTLRGIISEHGKVPQRARPLVKSDILSIINTIRQEDSLLAYRDKAMFLIGWAGAMRESELLRLKYDNLSFSNKGLLILLEQTKTIKRNEGHEVGIPYGKGNVCPVRALKEWLTYSGISEGYIFKGLHKTRRTSDNLLRDGHLTPAGWGRVIKKRCKQANIDPTFISSHSLRSGFVTTAIDAGMSTRAIQQQGGWKSTAMLDHYYRRNLAFEINLF
jgi:integrase